MLCLITPGELDCNTIAHWTAVASTLRPIGYIKRDILEQEGRETPVGFTWASAGVAKSMTQQQECHGLAQWKPHAHPLQPNGTCGWAVLQPGLHGLTWTLQGPCEGPSTAARWLRMRLACPEQSSCDTCHHLHPNHALLQVCLPAADQLCQHHDRCVDAMWTIAAAIAAAGGCSQEPTYELKMGCHLAVEKWPAG